MVVRAVGKDRRCLLPHWLCLQMVWLWLVDVRRTPGLSPLTPYTMSMWLCLWQLWLWLRLRAAMRHSNAENQIVACAGICCADAGLRSCARAIQASRRLCTMGGHRWLGHAACGSAAGAISSCAHLGCAHLSRAHLSLRAHVDRRACHRCATIRGSPRCDVVALQPSGQCVTLNATHICCQRVHVVDISYSLSSSRSTDASRASASAMATT